MNAERHRVLRAMLVTGIGLGCVLSACEAAIQGGGGALTRPPDACSPDPSCSQDASDTDVVDGGAFADIHLLVAADYPTSVAQTLPGSSTYCALWYASAEGAFVASFAAPNYCNRAAPPTFRQFAEVPAGRRPWRLNADEFEPSLAGGGAFTLQMVAMIATPTTVLADAVVGIRTVMDPRGGDAARLWAVAGGPKAGVHRRFSYGSGSESAAELLTFGGDNPPNATTLFAEPPLRPSVTALSNQIIIGDLTGAARVCETYPYNCLPARPLGKGRVDSIIAKPDDPFGKYALLGDSVVVASTEIETALVAKSSLATETKGFDGPGGYYAHAIASGQHCAYFSSSRGLEWARDVGGKLESGIVVPRAQLQGEILGVAVGPTPSKGEPDPDAGGAPSVDGGTPSTGSVVFFTSYAPKAGSGGVYFVEEPPHCTVGDFSVGGAVHYLPRSTELVLNDTYTLIVKANGRFVFPNRLPNGSDYTVTVKSSAECRVQSGGTGRIKGAHVMDVVINCIVPG